MVGRVGKFCVVCALVLATGFQWATLQSFAWGSMLASNLRTQSLSEALSQTFDGQHPCCLCKAIAAAKSSEKKSSVVLPKLKLEFPPVGQQLALLAPVCAGPICAANTFAESFPTRPPTPPPRSV